MKDFIELQINVSIKELLYTRVNNLLRGLEYQIPIIEFGDHGCGYAAVPVITLSTCETTEKERIIRIDTYTVTITFDLPECTESELYCYAYSDSVCTAINENPTLGGIVEKAVVTGKKYVPPKKRGCGEGWELVLSLRVTVEGMME